MTIRTQIEGREHAFLRPWATFGDDENQTRRERPPTPDDIRTEFQRDRDRILHAKSFRRLKHKTQCFLAPEGDHYRTRLTHALEVSQIARTLARALCLNEDLAEAISLGHDLGHTPYGHMGERILNRLMPEGFKHREQSLRVVEVLEREGRGLNLTQAVRDGILHHSGHTLPATLEGQCVSRADRIAYINHDIDDGLRAGILKDSDLPRGLTEILGKTHGERIERMIQDIVENSDDGQGVRMSQEVQKASDALRSFLYERVYLREEVQREEEKAERLLTALYYHTMENPTIMPLDYVERSLREGQERSVCDFIAGMTDRYAVHCFERFFVPSAFTRP